MTRELDAEVADDLARRSASERDASRRRQLARELPDPIVEHWPCRTGCGENVGQTTAGIASWRDANEQLAARLMKPLTKLEVMWCPACKAAEERRLAEARTRALLLRQTAAQKPEQPTEPQPLAAYLPTPRAKQLQRGPRRLR